MHSWKRWTKLFAVLAFIYAVPALAEAVLSPLAIHTKDGARLFQVEVAQTPEELQQGLMFRKALAPNAGMLFVMGRDAPVSFWMRNTLIPLDLVFIDRTGKIAHIHKMAKPHDETPLPSNGPVIAVLEIPGGEADKQGIHVGDAIDSHYLKQDR